MDYKKAFEDTHGEVMTWDEFKTIVHSYDKDRFDGAAQAGTLRDLNHRLNISHTIFYKWVGRARKEGRHGVSA